jgi:antitoxin (DNA-binding transcriptional repressor) of toxin-antitoxin stability system
MAAHVQTTPTHITEAELAEHLSEVLDRVAGGEHIDFVRDGTVIISLAPKRSPMNRIWTWGDLVQFLQTQSAFDEEFAANVRKHRDEQPQVQVPDCLE